MSIMAWAIIGGGFSALSTALGALLTPLFSKHEKLRQYHMSMDFALGVMLSAVAFSLVGPEMMKAHQFSSVFYGCCFGALFILITHKFIEKKFNSNKALLIAALIFHNLPEGMGSGASLAGMTLSDAIPLQVALSIQNIAEGLLLTLLLRSLGLNLTLSVIGGITSGLIEMSGAVMAGLLMQQTLKLLPFLLALAGGAMMTSVLLEIQEVYTLGKRLRPAQFFFGFLLIPLSNMLLG